MASINHLAEEMIFKILSLLPVLSLLQCKSVCKSWKTIISNPHFIQAHLTISQKQPPFALLLSVISKGSKVFFIETCGKSLIKLNLPCMYEYDMDFHFRCFNGLVALAHRVDGVFYIWNPLTRLFKLLPHPKIYPQYCYNFGFGFGFDSVSNDYKILRVVLPGLSNKGGDVMVAELYSVNADSWKEIRVPEEMNGFKRHPLKKCVCVDSGVLYIEGINGILSFDLHDEVFGLIQYPDSGKRMSEVLVFEGSVAVILKSSEEGSVLSLWTFDDVGGSFSWTKKFNFDPDLKMDYVHLYLGDGQFLAHKIGVGYFFFDVRKKGNKTPVAHLLGEKSISPVQFSGSLVSLKGFQRRK